MDFQAIEKQQQATIYLTGELDMSVGEKVGSILREYGERNQSVTVDFHDVTFVDSSGIGNLFFTTKELLALGRQVKIVNVSEEILDILRVLGFAEALGIDVSQRE